MVRYRSGHNGAVLKTVGGDESSVGSNPTRTARFDTSQEVLELKRYIRSNRHIPTLSDICKGIEAIIFVQDAMSFEFSDIFGSEDLDNSNPASFVLTKNDIVMILEGFKSCKSVVLAKYRRNLISENLACGEIEKADLLNIVKQLTISDFTKCIPNSNEDHKNDRLIEFITNRPFQLLNGNVLEGVKIYIKINLDESDDEALIAVSFHSTKSYGKHPYSEE